MTARYINGKVIAECPNCNGALSSYERIKDNSNVFGAVVQDFHHSYPRMSNFHFSRVIWQLLRCASCGSGGLAKIHANNNPDEGTLESFYPLVGKTTTLPKEIPDDIAKEYREAELCASFKAYRAASALVRSVLEKTLKANGYNNDDSGLKRKIELAASEHAITEARATKAHDNIKVLGDDVLHDAWREVTATEVEDALMYAQRVLEDFYTDRDTVVKVLAKAKRL